MLTAAISGAFLGFFLAQTIAGAILALTGDTAVGSVLGGVGAIVVGGLGIQLVKNTSTRSRSDAAAFGRLNAEIARKDATIIRLETALEVATDRINTLERRLSQYGGP